jgi:hypothetical protein
VTKIFDTSLLVFCHTMPTTHHCQCCKKLDSSPNTKSNAPFTGRSTTTKMTALDTLKNVSNAIVQRLRCLPDLSTTSGNEELVGVQKVNGVRDVTLLAEGGYNSIWLVELCASLEVRLSPLFILSPPRSQYLQLTFLGRFRIS